MFTRSHSIFTVTVFMLASICRSACASGPASKGIDDAPPYEGLPAGCKYYPQRETRVLPYDAVIANDYTASTYYAPTAVKRDVVCIGKVIRVDRLLRSNGGTMLVVADRLELNAPLDSRIYFWHSEKYWADVPPGSPAWRVSLAEGMENDRNVQRALDDWSLYHEVYVPTNHDYEWSVDSVTNPWQRISSFQKYEYHAVASPQLPFGMVSNEVDRSSNDGMRQPDAPVVPDRDAIRSGDIIILASAIVLCKGCTPAPDGSPDPTNGYIPTSYRAFINASGVNGGRGAPGGVAATATCSNCSRYHGGITGRASKGGDAGNIEIIKVLGGGAGASDDEILRMSRVEGGQGPYAGVRIVNVPSVVNSIGVRNDVTFEPFSADPNYYAWQRITEKDANTPTLADLRGRDGAVSLKSGVKADEALNIASDSISLLALHNYDSAAAAKALAAGDPDAGGFDPRVWFEHFLAAQVIDLETQLLNALQQSNGLKGGPGSSSKFVRPALAGSLQCEHLGRAALIDSTRVLVDRLCDFKDVSGSVSADFWIRNNGLLSVVPSGINFALESIRKSVNSDIGLAALNQIVGQLRDLNDSQYSEIERNTRGLMQEDLAKLREEADALSRKLAEDPTSLEGQLRATVGLAQAAYQAFESGAAAYDTPNTATIGKAGQDLKNVYDQYEAWLSVEEDYGGAAEKLDEIDYLMETVAGDMKSLDRAVNRRRIETDAEQAVTLAEYIRANAEANRGKDSVALIFTSMLRDQSQRVLGLGGFASGGYADGLTRIRDILQTFPDNEAIWPDGDIANPCVSHEAMPLGKKSSKRVCVEIPAGVHRGVLYSVSYPGVPLYVLPTVGQPESVPVGPLGDTALNIRP